MKFKYYYIILALFTLLLASCTEYIDMEPGDFEHKIVIDATVTNELLYHPVIISETKTIDEKQAQYVSGAVVTISANDSIIAYFESDTLSGYYYPEEPYNGIPGKNYHLKVTNVDINKDGKTEAYEATSTMGSLLEIDSIGYIYIERWEAVALTCFAYEPPETNFYNFRAWRNDTLTTDSIYEYSITDDLLINGSYTNGIQCVYFQDEYPDEYIEKGDTLTLGIENIDEAYFTYISSSINEYYGYNPMFGGMPANIESNISNGALGIFRVYTIAKSSVVVEKEIIRD